MSRDDRFGFLALLDRVSQRLLAENMLAGVHRKLDHLNVGSGVGDDGDRLYVGILAKRLGVIVNRGDAQFLRDLLGAVEVRVRNCNQLGARYAVSDVAGMLIAQTAYADDTDFQLFHR